MTQIPKVLVTGGAGFVGSHLAERLVEAGSTVRVLDNLSTGDPKNLCDIEPRISLIQADVTDGKAVESAVRGASTVFHLAAQTSVAKSIENPDHTNSVNVAGTLNLLEACVTHGVERLVYASSTAVYGNPRELPITEESPTNPISPYGASKLAAERYCWVYSHAYGLNTVILRYFNVYGPRQPRGGYSNVITSFADRILQGNPPVIYGDGDQTRDFIHVGEVVDATVRAATGGVAPGETFNVATGKPTAVNQLADIMLKLMEREDLEPIHADPRSGDIRRSYADTAKAEKQLGFKAKISLREGLENLLTHSRRPEAG